MSFPNGYRGNDESHEHHPVNPFVQRPGGEHGLGLSVSLTLQPFKRAYRVREIMAETGVSKPYIFSLLKTCELVGHKVGGVLLIDGQSYREWLESAVPWRPKGADE